MEDKADVRAFALGGRRGLGHQSKMTWYMKHVILKLKTTIGVWGRISGQNQTGAYEIVRISDAKKALVVDGNMPTAVEADLQSDEDMVLVKVLKVKTVFFHINEDDLNETASSFVSRRSELSDVMFVGVIDDLHAWSMFARMCGNPINLKVCVSIEKMTNEWMCTHLFGVVLSEHSFSLSDGKCVLNENFKNFCREIIQIGCDILLTRDLGSNVIQYLNETIESVADKVPFEKFFYSQYQVAMTKVYSLKQTETWAIVTSVKGKLVDLALELGVKRILVLGRTQDDVLFLKMRNEHEWSQHPDVNITVEVVGLAPNDTKVGVIVTDLLGIFGDDELLPEILQTCSSILNHDTIVMPSSYGSFVVPSSDQNVWTHFVNEGKKTKTILTGDLPEASFFSTPAKMFSFSHPNDTVLYSSKRCEFIASKPGILYGFCGWFECVLFEDITIESGFPTEDQTQPLRGFIPLPFQIDIHQGDSIQFHILRQTDDAYVWHEWCVTSPLATPLQNSRGRTWKKMIIRHDKRD